MSRSPPTRLAASPVSGGRSSSPAIGSATAARRDANNTRRSPFYLPALCAFAGERSGGLGCASELLSPSLDGVLTEYRQVFDGVSAGLQRGIDEFIDHLIDELIDEFIDLIDHLIDEFTDHLWQVETGAIAPEGELTSR